MGRGTAAIAIAAMALGAGCGQQASPRHPGELAVPFKVDARYSAESLGLKGPQGIAVGPDGNIYIADANQRITVVSPSGRVVRRWGRSGRAPGAFRFIAADPNDPTQVTARVAVDPKGLVYVSDSGNARIEVFTPQGRFVREFGRFGTGKGQFYRPFDLVADAAGNTYVIDDQLTNIAKFNKAGEQLWRIQAGSTAPDLTGHMHMLTMDSHGRLVIAAEEGHKVVFVDSDGREVDSFRGDRAGPGGTGLCEATVDKYGYTYTTGCGQPGPTLVFDRARRLVAEWPGKRYPLYRSPLFAADGEAYALGWDGSLLRLHVTLKRG